MATRFAQTSISGGKNNLPPSHKNHQISLKSFCAQEISFESDQEGVGVLFWRGKDV
jgi:hypothetical protein